MDFMLQNPDMRLSEVARHFGYTQSWLSIIIHSDAFRSEYNRRRGLIDARVAADIPTRLRALGSRALEQMENAFDTNSASMDLAREVLQLAAKAEGIGVPKNAIQPAPAVNMTFNVTPDMLQHARERMLSIRSTVPAQDSQAPALIQQIIVDQDSEEL